MSIGEYSAAMRLPPDRSHIDTEARNRRSLRFDQLTTQQCVGLMIADHANVAGAVQRAQRQLARLIDDLVERMSQGGRLIYIGAGTSGRLGVLDASECPPTFQSSPEQVIGIIAGGDRSLRRSSEGREDEPNGARVELTKLRLSSRDTLIGIAAGGTTPYVLGAIAIASEHGAMTGLLSCAKVPKPRGCDHLIVLPTGAEVLTGSTRLKAGSATKLALNMITTIAFTRLGKVHENLMVDVRATNQKLRDRAIRILIMLCPGLTRSQAAALLTRAQGDLKAAIVMQQRGVTRGEAIVLLEQTGRNLRKAIRMDRPGVSPAVSNRKRAKLKRPGPRSR